MNKTIIEDITKIKDIINQEYNDLLNEYNSLKEKVNSFSLNQKYKETLYLENKTHDDPIYLKKKEEYDSNPYISNFNDLKKERDIILNEIKSLIEEELHL